MPPCGRHVSSLFDGIFGGEGINKIYINTIGAAVIETP
jgi:hypothetical protein